MPNLNVSDSRNRDAVVKAESMRRETVVRQVDAQGENAYTRKVLKATIEQDYDRLLAAAGGKEDALAEMLVKSDPEIDFEKCGLFLWDVSRVFVTQDEEVVYRIEQTEIVRNPDGSEKERRPRDRGESNTDADVPLKWTGRKVSKADAFKRFVFGTKLQIVHVNGLTFDFLYDMAKELADEKCLMLVGGGEKGNEPLVFRRGSLPYRGFLEGRIDGDRYMLILHLSNLELKKPAEVEKAEEEAKAVPLAEDPKPSKKKTKKAPKKAAKPKSDPTNS